MAATINMTTKNIRVKLFFCFYFRENCCIREGKRPQEMFLS